MSDISETSNYMRFAKIYDKVMDHVDYNAWARYILEAFYRHQNKQASRIADLATGTGKLLKFIHRHNSSAQLTGLDLNAEMLAGASVACRRKAELVQGDLRKLPFTDQKFDLIVSTHDSVNYLLTEDDLLLHFQEAARVLEQNGMYVFDSTTEQNILRFFDGRTQTHKVGSVKLDWHNSYDTKKQIITSTLTFDDRRSQPVKEVHLQRFYPMELIKDLLSQAGMDCKKVHGDYRPKIPSLDTNLWVFRAVKR